MTGEVRTMGGLKCPLAKDCGIRSNPLPLGKYIFSGLNFFVNSLSNHAI